MNLGELSEAMQAHSETYQHIGVVNGYVHDLHPVWDKTKKQQLIVVESENLWFEASQEFPIPSALTWDYLTEPEYRRRWLGADTLQVTGLKSGRAGVGTGHHCAHGQRVSHQTIVDWRPFDHITYEFFAPVVGLCRWMAQLTPTEHGTQVSMRWAKPAGQGGLNSLFVLFMSKVIKGMVMKEVVKGHRVMQQLIADDLATGKIVVMEREAKEIGDSAEPDSPQSLSL